VKPQKATRALKSDTLKKLKCLSDKFLVTYTNADCLSSKWEEFSELIKQRKPHLVVVTEVLPKHFSDPSIFFQPLPQYNLVSNNSAKRGICMNIVAQQRGFEFYRHDCAKADYESMRQFISSINIMYELKNNHVSPDTAFDFVKKRC